MPYFLNPTVNHMGLATGHADIAPLTSTASPQYRPTAAWFMRLSYVYADFKNC